MQLLQPGHLEKDYPIPTFVFKTEDSQFFFGKDHKNSRFSYEGLLKSLMLNPVWTYLASQEAALKIFNVIGPFAKNLENLLFSKNIVIG